MKTFVVASVTGGTQVIVADRVVFGRNAISFAGSADGRTFAKSDVTCWEEFGSPAEAELAVQEMNAALQNGDVQIR